ncbi:SUN domain-containing protein 3 [Apodemus speciosus]|uniref:SUN domain-containing protein 3 n=1 Tax=Apodemus speciosus TaxID=105296 RepID=A0ABQ0F968_APOSI
MEDYPKYTAYINFSSRLLNHQWLKETEFPQKPRQLYNLIAEYGSRLYNYQARLRMPKEQQELLKKESQTLENNFREILFLIEQIDVLKALLKDMKDGVHNHSLPVHREAMQDQATAEVLDEEMSNLVHYVLKKFRGDQIQLADYALKSAALMEAGGTGAPGVKVAVRHLKWLLGIKLRPSGRWPTVPSIQPPNYSSVTKLQAVWEIVFPIIACGKHGSIFNTSNCAIQENVQNLDAWSSSVIEAGTSESYKNNKAKLYWHGIGFLNYEMPPDMILQPDVHPGKCWAFPGSQGHILIKLARKIIPTAVTMEHISEKVSPSGNISSAPKEFSVYGVMKKCEGEEMFLGQFIYNKLEATIQTFELQE